MSQTIWFIHNVCNTYRTWAYLIFNNIYLYEKKKIRCNKNLYMVAKCMYNLQLKFSYRTQILVIATNSFFIFSNFSGA